MTSPQINPEAATTPTITPTFKPTKVTWLFWYGFIILGLSALALQDQPPLYILLGIPLNFLIFFVPVWLITKLVRWMRRK
jgi:hypothetical protein